MVLSGFDSGVSKYRILYIHPSPPACVAVIRRSDHQRTGIFDRLLSPVDSPCTVPLELVVSESMATSFAVCFRGTSVRAIVQSEEQLGRHSGRRNVCGAYCATTA